MDRTNERNHITQPYYVDIQKGTYEGDNSRSGAGRERRDPTEEPPEPSFFIDRLFSY